MTPRALVGFEQSGVVRRALAARGWDAWSCDLVQAEDRSNRHLIGDVRDHLDMGWDMLAVFHPPCTRLCNSGVRWLHTPPPGRTLEEMWAELDEAADLFSTVWNADIPHIAVENPVMHGHAKARIRNYQPFAQSVQPWQFGHPEVKRTCFWLKDLPLLQPTNIVAGREARVHRMPPGPDRARERSRTFAGIAEAIAVQWGGHVLAQRSSPPMQAGLFDGRVG